jgi:hypothetical protein
VCSFPFTLCCSMSSVICGICSSLNFFIPFTLPKVVSHSSSAWNAFLLISIFRIYQCGKSSTIYFREMAEAPWCVKRMATGTRLELLALGLAVVVTTLLGCTQGCPCMNSGLQTLSYATKTDSSVCEITVSDEVGNYSEGWPLLWWYYLHYLSFSGEKIPAHINMV